MKGCGIVVSLNGSKAKVKVTSNEACEGCPSRSHCLGKTPRESEVIVINEYGARVSDYVIFEADTGKVIISAILIWILPILSMIAGYIITAHFLAGFWPLVMAFLSLAFSFLILKLVDNAISGGKIFYPTITKVLDTPESVQKFFKDV